MLSSAWVGQSDHAEVIVSPAEQNGILEALTRLETKLDSKADKTDIARLETKVDLTNGRVTSLEKENIKHDAVEATRSTLKTTIWKATAAIIGAIGTVVIIVNVIIDNASK